MRTVFANEGPAAAATIAAVIRTLFMGPPFRARLRGRAVSPREGSGEKVLRPCPPQAKLSGPYAPAASVVNGPAERRRATLSAGALDVQGGRAWRLQNGAVRCPRRLPDSRSAGSAPG